jgi:micrococcal nuclease
VDGDTLDVEVDGETERIRLLNIDTPETKDPARPVECLGPEASDFLARLIPVGSHVRLEFDKERKDQYDRTLAAVFAPDGRMVNAEVARAGLAQVVTYGENVRFRPSIEQAWREAAANKRGLHALDVPCTVSGQAQSATTGVANSPKTAAFSPDRNSAEFFNAALVMGSARVTAQSLLDQAEQGGLGLIWLALTPDEQESILAQLRSARDEAQREVAALHMSGTAAKQREDDAARAAAQAEADRIAREQAASEAAEERRLAAAHAAGERRAAAAARAAEPVDVPDSSSTTRHTGNTGHPCLPGERDGDHDGYCGEGR